MAAIFKDQPLILQLETGTDLSGADSAKISYKKPDGTTGEFSATVVGTKLQSTLAGESLNAAGWWYFHSKVVFSGDTKATIGERASLYIYNEFERPILNGNS
jgi:hypothetical protein